MEHLCAGILFEYLFNFFGNFRNILGLNQEWGVWAHDGSMFNFLRKLFHMAHPSPFSPRSHGGLRLTSWPALVISRDLEVVGSSSSLILAMTSGSCVVPLGPMRKLRRE
jgi:hypothetical protein